MPGKLCEQCGRATPPGAVRCPACGVFVPVGEDDDAALAVIRKIDAHLGRHYRVEEEIGRGGAAIVYRVFDERLKRNLALKLLNPAFFERSETAVRFRREAATSAALSHPNIVQVFFVGDQEQHPFYVMPLVDGEPLRARLRREGQLSPEATASVARDVASALDFAHRKGVIHRDVKPDNVLLETATGRSLLTDFGIAKAISGETGITQTGMVVGTPYYVSPEQASGEGEVDARTDLYSLGVMVWEMLTGQVPFRGDSPQVLFAQHAQAEVPSLVEHCPEVPSAVDGVMRSVLAKRPEDRPDSAQEFVAAFEAAIGKRSLRSSGESIMPRQIRSDISQFRTLDSSDPKNAEALDSAKDPAEAAEAAEAMERRLMQALEEGKWLDLGTGLEVLLRRFSDHRPAYRHPVERVLRHISSDRRTVELLGTGWRTAAPDNQGRIEQILAGLFEINEMLVELACRERSPAYMLLADRVGAIDAHSVDILAKDTRLSAIQAFLQAVSESTRPDHVIEQWLLRIARHENEDVRIMVLATAAERGGLAAERLGRLGLSARELKVREAALRTMGRSKRKEVLPALAQRLENGQKPEQVAAALGLADLGMKEAIPILEKVFQRRRLLKAERGPVQRAAAVAIAMFGAAAEDALERLSQDGDKEVRTTAQTALAKLG
jgi:serine/threonine protein kinase